MGKKISQITTEETSSVSDTDVFEGEESGGTSFKTLFSVIKSTLYAAVATLTNKTINLANNTLTGTVSEFNDAMVGGDFATTGGVETLTNKTLTTPTIASLANANHNHTNAAGGGTLNSAALATSPYVLQASCATINPTDATTYYLGSLHGTTPTTTAGRRRVYIPRSGTVTRIDLFINCATGSGETFTVSFRLNDTTDTTISSAVDLSATPFVANVTGLSIAVVAGNYFEIKVVTPTWVTDPTAVAISAQVYIS